MALNWKVGTFTKSNSTAVPFDQSITDVGFTPKLVLFFSSSTGSALSTIYRPAIGATSGVGQNRCISWGSDNAQDMITAGTNAFRRCTEEYCFELHSGTTSNHVKAKLKSFDTNVGFTLTYDSNDTSTYPIEYIALGGADITNVKVGSFNLTTSTGQLSITDPGFSPDAVLFFGSNINPNVGASSNASSPHAIWFLGAAGATTAQQCVSTGISLDAITSPSTPATPHCNRYQRVGSSGSCIAYFTDGSLTTLGAEARFVSAITQGFIIDVLTPPASTAEANARPIFYVAIKGGSWNTGYFNTPVNPNTGNQTVSGTPAIGSYTPKGVLVWGNQGTGGSTIDQSGAGGPHRYVVGSATASGPGTQWNQIGGDDNTPATTSTETVRGRLLTTLYRAMDETSAPSAATDIKSSGAFSSFGSGNFVINWGTLDANDRQVLFLVGGDSPAGQALVKVANDTVHVSEAVLSKRTKARIPTADTANITEAVSKQKGIVKVNGAPALVTTGGFTAAGFLSSGFTVPQTAQILTADYTPADFDANDFQTQDHTVLVPGLEQVGVSETTVKILTLASAIYVTASDLVIYYSGGGSYNGDSEGGIGSKGGAISSYPVVSNQDNSGWDDVGGSESSAGDTEFRCFYLKNNHGSLTAYDVRMWISTNTPGGDSVQIATGAAAVNATETAVADENTDPSQANPAILFSTAPDENSYISLGNIPSGQYKSFWIKREVLSSTSAYIGDSYTLRVSFVSSHA